MNSKRVNFTFDATNSTFKIDDNLKWNYFLIRTAGGLTVVNSILFPLGSEEHLLSFSNLAWFIVGTASLLLLLYSLLKKSTTSEIAASEIAALLQRNFFGKTRYSLLLKNGKKRDLYFETAAEMAAVRELLTTKQIPVR